MSDKIRELTQQQKLAALAHRFYQGAEWLPKAGDYYTSSRADLELYRVVKIEGGKIFTEYCTRPGELAEWGEDGFTTDGFGPRRVHVPEFVIAIAQQPAPVAVRGMVDRFLGWRLPQDFSPDAGVSFVPPINPAWWPTGTNLLSADQAKAMFEYVTAAPAAKEGV